MAVKIAQESTGKLVMLVKTFRIEILQRNMACVKILYGSPQPTEKLCCWTDASNSQERALLMHLREEEWKSVGARLSTCVWMYGGETVLLQGVEVPKVKEFRYLGSTVQCSGGCGSEVKRRVQAGWNDWRRVSGVICNRRLSACAKGKVYKTVVRRAMLYGLETVPLTKKQEAELAVADVKIWRCWDFLWELREWTKLRMSLFEGLLCKANWRQG